MTKTSFVGVVRLNDEGELLCFCYQKDVDEGLCACRGKFDCPEALVEISLIPGTKPSDTSSPESLVKPLRDASKSAEIIKKGLTQLEKSIQKNSRFRF